MERTCDAVGHRKALLESEYAACYDCLNEFSPSDIEYWCDNGETALCPYCGLDFVIGFNGAVDRDWLLSASKAKFPGRHKKVGRWKYACYKASNSFKRLCHSSSGNTS